MHRPTRQLNHLLEKVARKESIRLKTKPGKRIKRWKKWIETYKGLSAEAAASA